ncbi:MAG: DUF1236 domain-containing protein [Pseudomonadota bacterium]|nr:DUF1236 domain-containing protein [Pseudomonadota bacterium]
MLSGTALSWAQEAPSDAEELLQNQQASPDAGQADGQAAGQAETPNATGSMTGTAQGEANPDGSVSGTAEGQAQTGATGTSSDQQQQTGEAESQQPTQGEEQQQTGEADGQQPAAGETESDAASSEQGTSTEMTGSIDINTEQRTEITQVFRDVDTDPVDVDFDINVGAAVPGTVVLHPLPPRVVEIVPDYRGYEYFVLADGRIVIVEPGTLKIVYILVV